MEFNEIKDDILLTITLAILFAVGTEYFMDEAVFENNFPKIMAQFYAIVIINIVVLYVSFRFWVFDKWFRALTKKYLLLNLLFMVAVLYLITFPNKHFNLINSITGLIGFISETIGFSFVAVCAVAFYKIREFIIHNVFRKEKCNSMIESMLNINWKRLFWCIVFTFLAIWPYLVYFP